MKKNIYFLATFLSISVPGIVFAAEDLLDIMDIFVLFFGYMVGMLGIAAVAAFFWGIAIFIMNTSDDKKREEGKQWMLWSIVALFVMVTLWGILGFISRSFGVLPSPLPPLG